MFFQLYFWCQTETDPFLYLFLLGLDAFFQCSSQFLPVEFLIRAPMLVCNAFSIYRFAAFRRTFSLLSFLSTRLRWFSCDSCSSFWLGWGADVVGTWRSALDFCFQLQFAPVRSAFSSSRVFDPFWTTESTSLLPRTSCQEQSKAFFMRDHGRIINYEKSKPYLQEAYFWCCEELLLPCWIGR